MIKLWEPVVRIIFNEINLALIAIKHVLFPCPIQVNSSFLPTRVFTSYRIKTVVFRMILICDVVLGLVYNQGADPYPDKECQVAGKGSSEVSDGYLHTEDIQE